MAIYAMMRLVGWQLRWAALSVSTRNTLEISSATLSSATLSPIQTHHGSYTGERTSQLLNKAYLTNVSSSPGFPQVKPQQKQHLHFVPV